RGDLCSYSLICHDWQRRYIGTAHSLKITKYHNHHHEPLVEHDSFSTFASKIVLLSGRPPTTGHYPSRCQPKKGIWKAVSMRFSQTTSQARAVSPTWLNTPAYHACMIWSPVRNRSMRGLMGSDNLATLVKMMALELT
ncbi:hypothetical protein CLAIMM_13587, partial [Cladophialophora immunda]